MLGETHGDAYFSATLLLSDVLFAVSDTVGAAKLSFEAADLAGKRHDPEGLAAAALGAARNYNTVHGEIAAVGLIGEALATGAGFESGLRARVLALAGICGLDASQDSLAAGVRMAQTVGAATSDQLYCSRSRCLASFGD